MNFGFIGAGNMSSAIIRGLLQSEKANANQIFVFDILKSRIDALAENFSLNVCSSNMDVVKRCELVILGVKPNVLETVLKEISDTAKEVGVVLVSIAAGKDISFLERNTCEKQPVVRVMPNVNAMVLESMSAICRNNYVLDSQLETVIDIFSFIGKTVILDEKHFSTFIGLSGSAPAYVYLFINSMAIAGVKAGLDKATALEIASQAVLGSAKTVLESGKHPWELIDMVCSPGGTTIEGIADMLENSFEGIVLKAVEAVINKDKALKLFPN